MSGLRYTAAECLHTWAHAVVIAGCALVSTKWALNHILEQLQMTRDHLIMHGQRKAAERKGP